MSLVGCKVSHPKWGVGIVEQLTDITLEVRFSDGEDGVLLKKFIFPDAITQGYISGVDAQSTLLIEKAMEKQKCSVCGTSNVVTEEIENNRFCRTCKKTHTDNCVSCGKDWLKKSIVLAEDDIEWEYKGYASYAKIPLCSNCADNDSFICGKCNRRYTMKHRATSNVGDTNYCHNCFKNISKKCSMCGTFFERDLGNTINRKGEVIYVCPTCSVKNVFRCSKCGAHRLTSARVDSPYVAASQNICEACTTRCAACDEIVYPDNNFRAFGKYYCPACWENSLEECAICGELYLPQNDEKKKCPDCLKMEGYASKIKGLDYLHDAYKTVRCYSLEYMDRCKLFTQLYENTLQKFNDKTPICEADPYAYLLMELGGYKIVVAYLSSGITRNIRYSADLTMTELRQTRGRIKVRQAIAEWLESSDEYMDTSAGRMKILAYPISLRVQTDYDKNYGKQWNGPGDYIEIGNYGDTTKFWMIGVLDQPK